MKPEKFSRRRLLGGVFVALLGWLCQRPARATPTPRRLSLAALFPPSEPARVVRYVYDASGRLISSEYHSVVATQPRTPCRCTVCAQVTTYTY